jgi:hypothetical protein
MLDTSASIKQDYKIIDYLTEEKLVDFVKFITKDKFISTEYKIEKYSYDVAYYNKDNKIILVEFDGDSHYTRPDVIKRDIIKDKLVAKSNFSLIRIPYFIQLNNETFKYYFKEDYNVNIIQDFPHGFIESKIYPSYYCELGIDKFKEQLNEINKQFPNICLNIKDSLIDKIKNEDIEYIIPHGIYNYFKIDPQIMANKMKNRIKQEYDIEVIDDIKWESKKNKVILLPLELIEDSKWILRTLDYTYKNRYYMWDVKLRHSRLKIRELDVIIDILSDQNKCLLNFKKLIDYPEYNPVLQDVIRTVIKHGVKLNFIRNYK